MKTTIFEQPNGREVLVIRSSWHLEAFQRWPAEPWGPIDPKLLSLGTLAQAKQKESIII